MNPRTLVLWWALGMAIFSVPAYAAERTCESSLVASRPRQSKASWAPTFGDEVERTNDQIEYASYDSQDYLLTYSEWSLGYQEAIAEDLRGLFAQRDDGTRVRMGKDRYGVTTYKISYRDGYSFTITLDPYVLEYKTKGASVGWMKRHQDDLQRDLYDEAASFGLRQGREKNTPEHTHIGAMTFEDNVLFFRNTLVDWYNHPDFQSDVLGGDPYNAPLIQDLAPAQRKAFADIVGHEFYMGKFKTINDLVDAIFARVYYDNPAHEEEFDKYQALNITRMHYTATFPKKARTLELRFLRGQKDAAGLIREKSMLAARLNYLRQLKEPLALDFDPIAADIERISQRGASKLPGARGLSQARLQKLLTDTAKVDRFYRWVIESGWDWNEARLLMPARLRKIPPTLRLKPVPEMVESTRAVLSAVPEDQS